MRPTEQKPGIPADIDFGFQAVLSVQVS